MFNLLVLLLVLLITAYLANQGLLSAILMFIAATFASLLAGGLYEPLQSVIMGYRPDFARGATFLLLFFFAFSLCRLTADFAVPKNIKLPRMIDAPAAGVVSLFASLVIMGSLLIGIEMLPLGTTLLGYNRYPGERRMQATREDGDALGTLIPPSNIWFAPDALTVGFWNLALGKALGGNTAFAAVHPDLLTESYGYRNTVQYGVPVSVHPDLMKVTAAYTTEDAGLLKKFQIADPSKRGAVVRTEVDLGTDPKISSISVNGANIFFITPTQVRLVTDKGHQYYPIGYLESGVNFIPKPLDVGQLGEEYSSRTNKVVDDWVFQIDMDEKPLFLEMKQLARVQLTDVLKDKPVPALARGDYPPRAAKGTLAVNVASPEHPIKGAKVFLLQENLKRRDADSLVADAYNNVLNHQSPDDTNWANAFGKPGVPDKGLFSQSQRNGLEIKNRAPDDQVTWVEVLPLLLTGAAVPDGPRNLTVIPDYFNKSVVPLFSSLREGNAIIASGETDDGGNLTLKDIPKGSFELVCAAKTDNGFYFWVQPTPVGPKEDVKKDLNTGSPNFQIVLPK